MEYEKNIIRFLVWVFEKNGIVIEMGNIMGEVYLRGILGVCFRYFNLEMFKGIFWVGS